MIKDDIMDLAIAIPRRFYKYEKAMYLQEVEKRFAAKGYKAMVQPFQGKGKAIHNVIFGDIESSKVVVLTSYDTPSKTYKPNYRYYPFNPQKNLNQERISLLIQLVIGLLLAGVGLLLGYHGFNQVGWLKYIDLVVAIGLIISGIWFFQSHGNKANMSRNSASIALMLDLAGKVDKQKVAFVLLDQNSDGHKGLAHFASGYTNHSHDQIWLVLDGVAYGNTIVLAHTKKDDGIAKMILNDLRIDNGYDKSYSKDHATKLGLTMVNHQFQLSIGDIIDQQFFIPFTKTKQDVHINIEQLIHLSNGLVDAIHDLSK